MYTSHFENKKGFFESFKLEREPNFCNMCLKNSFILTPETCTYCKQNFMKAIFLILKLPLKLYSIYVLKSSNFIHPVFGT